MPQKTNQMTLRMNFTALMLGTFSRLMTWNYDRAMPTGERVYALRGRSSGTAPGRRLGTLLRGRWRCVDGPGAALADCGPTTR
ncbi:hypothetical protein GCM10010502_00720 [Kitasatospora aureofaciens]|uniref:Uncharacterized protein n=1 Tax=Kitasatospora aureofaciens TaxID=1894 RepID=A0A8H9HBN1_KITAU|nr:hypothetical protein GCM10010502_00720 [Kitasatospora aureofaciens]